jgi:23S rRNA (guanine2445-N2)-methyltransferase / 23S rRNA (guanine2069-N7)-methyltransferase
MEQRRFFAPTARGMEPLLAAEASQLGGQEVEAARAGVYFSGSLATAYTLCLWSRTASRIILPLAWFEARQADELYEGVRQQQWEDHIAPDGTLAVDCQVVGTADLEARYAALKTKDAIVDRLRDRYGRRPSVRTVRPDVRVNLFINGAKVQVGLDLAGESLHRRGYRHDGSKAPLKETLAAAILLRAGWAEMAAGGEALVDPMCGSGTLVMEAALIAGDIAPGLGREYFGFNGWLGFEPRRWAELLEEARQRGDEGRHKIPTILGSDHDIQAIKAAQKQVEDLGLGEKVQILHRSLEQARPPKGQTGLVVANPPYGERMGSEADLKPLYGELGAILRGHFGGWQAAVFTGNPTLAKQLRVQPRRSYTLFNGTLKCRLLCFGLDRKTPKTAAHPSAAAVMLVNRLGKNLRHLGRWARRQGINAYRIYESDLPDYAFAVDIYQGRERWLHVQEYEAPAEIDPLKIRQRREEALLHFAQVFEVPPERLVFKLRRRQKGKDQYLKEQDLGRFIEVEENGLRFLVNLTDYLDTGLFLDHRETRRLLGEWAGGKDFLNLFGYTAAASVYAARGGARSTTTIDLSQTYLDWGRKNLELNGLRQEDNRLIQEDCRAWLQRQAARPTRSYGLVFLDPPTFSNSKKASQDFDIQRDHTLILEQVARLMAPGGILVFSTNFRRFKMAEAQVEKTWQIKDISAATIMQDFKRNQRIHQCWRMELAR